MYYPAAISCGMRKRTFAEVGEQCNNMPMRKHLILAVAALSVGIILSSSAQAQQTPAASSPATPAAKATPATPAKTSPATTAKPAAKPAAAAPLTTDKEKDSYAVGLNMGRGLKRQPVDLDTASLLRGLKDSLDSNKALLTDDEVDAALKQLQSQVQKQQDAELAKIGEANMKEGEAFLAANKAKDGVVTLPSGLQYKIVTAGTGAQPTAKDTVVCNYRGTSIDGTEFDSSYKRGQPATFAVGGVIKGWTEALQLMTVGSKWQLFVPPDLGYGQRGTPNGPIGPNQTLVFDVELISIKGQ
jgi:FKBP-type peptidyl-prolyl cis-trans isomerase FklB